MENLNAFERAGFKHDIAAELQALCDEWGISEEVVIEALLTPVKIDGRGNAFTGINLSLQ